MQPIIRTSDRNQFRRCRQAWDYGSKIRQNYQSVQPVAPLDFGSAVHDALEVWYDPRRWEEPKEVKTVEAHAAFMKWMQGWKKRLKDGGWWESQKSEWEDHQILGLKMLDHYFEWSKERDKDWKPLFTEVEFEIPIPVSDALHERLWGQFDSSGKYNNFLRDKDGYLRILNNETGDYDLVLYQGRIDLIVLEISTGRIYIVDHKTAKQFGGTQWLDLDTQCSSYAWAAKKVLNIDIDGVIYNQLRKKAPEMPKVLKDGTLSKAKGQNTTREIYLREIERLGLAYEDYALFLQIFQGQEYFRRIPTERTMKSFEHIGNSVVMEAIDMLDDPFIYPNPNMFNCGGCAFYVPCQIKQDGDDDQWQLEHSGLYINRSKAEKAKNF